MEFIILQPLQTNSKDLNVSLIQRRYELTPDEESSILHEGDGQYEGFVIKKSLPQHMQASLNLAPCHLLCKLKLYMKHATNSETRHERRTLQFWFSASSEKERSDCYNTFLRSLLKPDNFPRDYFSFLLKIMLIFKELKATSLLKIDIEKLDDQSAPSTPMSLKDPKQYAAIITGKILEYLERSFPNMMSVTELARLTETQHDVVYEFLRDLYSRGLVKYFDNGNSWMRNIVNSQEDQTHDVIMVQNQPKVSAEEQPTIAIITVNYYEKLAVDAMMTNKVTFVRHKADGESNVYTIGVIGEHRVVTTKLPLLNRDIRTAKISSGNSTTRLLGNFQKVEHVILVGCAGGVPHYSDHTKHPRRGDIVVSYPESTNDSNDDDDQNFVYAHYDIEKNNTQSRIVSKTWTPSNIKMYKIVNRIRKTYDTKLNQLYPWEGFLQDGIKVLSNEELDCRRPSEDKLFFTVGEKNIIEVDHPVDETNSQDRQRYGLPTLRFGKIGAGDSIVKDETLRYRVSELNGIICYDNDLDQVMEAIEGSRKESFIIIRGIADYVDGTTTKEWQPYAALSAASFAKTLISELPATPPSPH